MWVHGGPLTSEVIHQAGERKRRCRAGSDHVIVGLLALVQWALRIRSFPKGLVMRISVLQRVRQLIERLCGPQGVAI